MNSLAYPSLSPSLSPSLCLSLLQSLHPVATLKAVCLGWQHFKIEEAWSQCLEKSRQKELPELLQTVTRASSKPFLY